MLPSWLNYHHDAKLHSVEHHLQRGLARCSASELKIAIAWMSDAWPEASASFESESTPEARAGLRPRGRYIASRFPQPLGVTLKTSKARPCLGSHMCLPAEAVAAATWR